MICKFRVHSSYVIVSTEILPPDAADLITHCGIKEGSEKNLQIFSIIDEFYYPLDPHEVYHELAKEVSFRNWKGFC